MKRLIAVAAVSLLAWACGPNNVGLTPDAGNNNADAGSGQNACVATQPKPFICSSGGLVYPSCPYATTRGGVFPDYVLTGSQWPGSGGYWDPNMSPTTAPVTFKGNLSTYFNDTMAFHLLRCAQAAGFKFAMIDVSSVWCPHCQDEAAQLPATYVPGWLQKGGIVFSILEDGQTPGTPATLSDLNTWVNKYGTNYPISIDPQETLVSGLNLQAWPANLIIDLRTMTVVDAMFGADFSFYQEFDAVLNQ